MEPNLSPEFRTEYSKFIEEFDSLATDSFQGEKLEVLAKSFFDRHQLELSKIPFPSEYKFPNCSPIDALQEDVKIINNFSAQHASEVHDILSNLYRRLCQGTYFRITFNNSRMNMNEDRNEACQLGRFAIRYNPSNYFACYWYMIAIGWHLEAVSNARERTIGAIVFRDLSKRCIEFDENDPLPHNLLGRYYYHVAGLSWLEKTVAKNLLGGQLDGTYQDAERELLLSHKLKNDWAPTGLWMARVLLAQKRPREEVRRWIDFGLDLNSLEPTTEIEKRDLMELDAKLKK